MTRHETIRRDVPGRPDHVLERMRDPEVARRRAVSDPVLQGEVLDFSTGEQGGFVLTIGAELPSSWIPQMGRGLSGLPRIVRREEWRPTTDGGADIDVDVTLESIPATTMTASGRLDPAGEDNSLLTFDLGLTVALPLAGARIERAVLDRIGRAYERECDVIATACS